MVGSIIAAVAVAIGVTVGILYSDNTQLHIMICLVGTIVLLCVRGLVLISIKLIVDIASMHKSEEINNNFASQLSHQIRTPLNNIVLIGSLLNQTNLTSRQKDWLETIIASANNLATVVNVFSSSLSAVRTEDEKINNVSFKIHTVLDSIIQAYVGQSEDYNIGIKPIMEEQHLLKGNPIQIKQIFMNLIDTIINNRKVDKINIIISYNVKQETNNLFNISFEVRVTDLFDLSAQSVENSGEMFNFSVAKKLIAMTGSELNVEVTDKYTMFTFSLSFERSQQTDTPDVTDISHKKLDTESNSIFQDTSKVDLKAANVLLVEDNLINQRIVVLSIRKLVKNIDIANNGLEAVEKFNQTGYNIILMDLQMPLMDGIQATKKIREIESEKQTIPTPIIAITANALTGDREHCLASGMDDYLPKPFQVEMLVAKMKNLLAS
jgi:CheY-like chemotaxis protein